MNRFFSFAARQTNFKHEIIAGLSTFWAMAYILVVNPTILSDAGMDFGAAMVATIIVTALACFLMAVMANYPIAIAPGMGVSAYIAYTVVLGQGKSWEECLGAVFIVALLLFLLTLFRVRQKLLTEIPLVFRHAIPAAIGLFLVCVGLKHVGIIAQTKGGSIIAPGEFLTLEALFTLVGVAIILALEALKVRSAFIIAILFCWALGLMFGLSHFEGIVALPPSLKPTLLKLDFSKLFQWDYLAVIFSIFLVTLLDSSAALVPLIKQAGLINERGFTSRMRRALIPDTIGSFVGSLIGSASLAVHMESAAGIKAGGKTGLVPLLVSLCFLGCLFFYPIVATIPRFAPAAVLIVLGLLMAGEVKEIRRKDWTDFVPALVIIISMPLTLSIFNGFSLGFISYALLKLVSGKIKEIHPFVGVLALLFLTHRILSCFM